MEEHEVRYELDKIQSILIDELGYKKAVFLRNVYEIEDEQLNQPIDMIVEINGDCKIVVETHFKSIDQIFERNIEDILMAVSDYLLIMSDDGIRCYELTGEIHEYWFENSKTSELFEMFEKSEVHNWKEELSLKSKKTIQEIHYLFFEKLYELHRVNNDFRFVLRQVNRAGRLNKGYFFHGNENYCALSFWIGADDKNKTPNIYVEVEDKESFVLRLTCRDDENKVVVMEKIAKLLGANRVKRKGEAINLWQKYYYQNTKFDYIAALEEFLEKDKEIIDLIIETATDSGIDFIPKEEFEKNLARTLRVKGNIDKQKGTSSVLESSPKEQPVLRLKSLHLQHISQFNDIHIDLKPRVICILGENGLGKTSILRAIALGLVGIDNSGAIDETTKPIKNLLQIGGHENGYPKRASQGVIELDYRIEDDYQNKILFSSVGDRAADKVKIEDVLSTEMPSFGVLYEGDYFEQLIIGFSQNRGGQRYRDKEDSEEVDIMKPNLKDLLPLIYDEQDNRFEDLKQWLINLHSTSSNEQVVGDNVVDKTKGYKVVVKTIFEIISDVIGYEMKLVTSDAVSKRLWVQEGSNEPVLFELLSQGFRNIFGWVGHFVRRLAESTDYSETFLNENAIVLIDEIDAYLHPLWQRNILHTLVKHFPKTQFIVTTHSPLVMNYLRGIPTNDKALYVLHRENGKIGIEQYYKTYGRGLKAIFRDWMGIGEYPAQMLNKVNQILELIEEETAESLEKAKAAQIALKEDLEEEDDLMLEVTMALEMAEENLKIED